MFEDARLKELIGKYYGVYRGKVIDNKDKDFLGRCTLEVPSVYGSDIESPWAFPDAKLGGNVFFDPPPVGSYVWVEFEQGDVNFPTYRGGPIVTPPEEVLKTVDGKSRKVPGAYGWKTPMGHLIMTDDDPDKPNIRIVHSSGSTLLMDDEGNIKLTPKSGTVFVEGTLDAKHVDTVTLAVEELSELKGEVKVGGNATFAKDVAISGTTSATGDATFAANVDVGGNVKCASEVSAQTLKTTGNANVGGNLDIVANTKVGGDLEIIGELKTGEVNTGEVKATGQVAAGSLSISGNAEITGTLTAKIANLKEQIEQLSLELNSLKVNNLNPSSCTLKE